MPFERVHHIFIGLDLGQRRDFTALAVLAAVTHTSDARDPVTYKFIQREELRLIHVHRFPRGTPYTRIPVFLRRICNSIDSGAPITIVIDGSGPGGPVVNMVKSGGLPAEILVAMILSEGDGARPNNGVYTIGRRFMLSAIRVGAELGCLRVADRVPFRRELLDELMNVSEANLYTPVHDDIVFALALAVFGARKRNPSLLRLPDS